MVEDNMGKKTVAMISGKVDLEKEKPKALLIIPKLDLESNSIGSSRTSIGNGRKNKNSKIFMPSEHNGLKLSTFKNSKSNNKKDFKKNEVNDLGNFSEHIEVEKIGSNEKKITQKGKQIKGVENLKNHGADTNSLEEDLNVLRSRLESNNFSENQTETPKSKNNVNLLEAKKSNGSSLEKNVYVFVSILYNI
ncbi:hypothetical protein BY996DRAFT_755264 [Phakopsora pachyrhizi]|nr:hypothetical protein BY996DRAFT_755264 [Phakopsora pachyrhizi]